MPTYPRPNRLEIRSRLFTSVHFTKSVSLTLRAQCLSFSHACRLFLYLALLVPSARAVDIVPPAQAQPNLETLADLYNAGEYEQAIDYASEGQIFDSWTIDWETTKAKSLLALGRYEEAFLSLQAHVAERNFELRPRLLLREAALFTGRKEEARRQLDALGYLVNERSRRYSYDPENIVAIGKIALLYDVEPKIVLENFYRRAQDFGTSPASAYIAAGDLALSKRDYKLASKTFQKGLEAHPLDAELWSGLASSFREGDASKLIEYAERALTINPRHVPSLLLIAEHMLAAESFDEARRRINLALIVNPLHPDALALKAALAYLRDEDGDALRKIALSTWPDNPAVDYRIGLQLSRKYRFTEGSQFQRQALQLDNSFHPARMQLAQDLLRLGRNEEAWQHADAVHEADPYDIAAYNLATLRDRLDEFKTLESENFILRLSSSEADVYGPRALRILETAHARLSERYGVELPQKTTVEIYPNPADFETRTFGMPGNPGYLGVCFGPVFTINSPATRSANWEAVLYHEFCHSITLSMTKNRMPRWLSEGISVFEEQVANPAWGQRMSASYRDRILSSRMQAISSMSSAFLQAQDGEDIQFAYYQSYLVVEYLTQTYGMEALKSLLTDLGQGIETNSALATHFAPLETLDSQFNNYAKQVASQLAPNFRFTTKTAPLGPPISILQPKTDYSEALNRAQALLEKKEWKEAIEMLEPLVKDTNYLPGPENAQWAIAKAYRGTGDIEKEIDMLTQVVQHEANRLDPIIRLHEIAVASQNSQEQLKWSDAWLAINPMAETPWRSSLDAARKLDQSDSAIEAAQSLLSLQAPDSPSLHFQLAELLQNENPIAAKRHVLMALEEAPRFQKAYQLLAKLQTTTAPPPSPINHLESLDLNNDFTR